MQLAPGVGKLVGPVSPLCPAVPQVVPQVDCLQMNSEAQQSSQQPLFNKLLTSHGTETGGLGHMSTLGWSMSQGLGRADWLVWVMCPLPPLQSLQDPWTGERVIFRGRRLWLFRGGSQGTRCEVCVQVKPCQEARAPPAKLKTCGCQDLRLRKPPPTSKGPVCSPALISQGAH